MDTIEMRGKNYTLVERPPVAGKLPTHALANCGIEGMSAAFVGDTLTTRYTMSDVEFAAICALAHQHLNNFSVDHPGWKEEKAVYRDLCKEFGLEFKDLSHTYKENLKLVTRSAQITFNAYDLWVLMKYL